MANTDAAFGLRPIKLVGGGTVGRQSEYSIASGYSSNIFNGSPVKSTGTGRNIAIASAGDTMLGVFAGVSYKDSNGEIQYRQHWPASTVATEVKALVYDDPNILFEVQADEDIVAADIGATADLVNTTTGSTSTELSLAELDSSTIGTTGGVGVKIHALSDRPDNATGNYAKVLVLINEHELRPGTLTGV